MRLAFLSALAALLALASNAAEAAPTPVYGYRIVHAYPHDPGAFTEGLFYEGGWLYESTGLEGHSFIQKVKLETGKAALRRTLDPSHFGEGIVAWRGRLIQLTWREQLGFTYDLATFKPTGTFHYPGEGWALTHDATRLIMSDGTPQLRFLNPQTLQETGRITVRDQGQPVANLNELESVDGEVLANIWMTDRIARIDPASGRVKGWIDLSGLAFRAGASMNQDAVLNGIAYDARSRRLFVTGKLWPKLFEIQLVDCRKAPKTTGCPGGAP
jgi:glutamine cyclotransferase